MALRSHSLAEYRKKRDFDRTPEPAGSARRRRGGGGKSRFCVQKHLASHLHYDFRLEHRGVLLSWAVPKGPSLRTRDKRLAMMTEDHPLDYIDFEGVIPEGYGAGIVMVWDEGTWQPEDGFEDVDAALKGGELKFTLDGYKLKGSWVLVRTGGRRGTDTPERSWLLIKHRDDWAGEVDITAFAPLSIKTGRDFADILAQGDPDVWESHRPAQGGQTGRLFEQIIRKAVRIRQENQAGRQRQPAGGRKKKTAKKKPGTTRTKAPRRRTTAR